MRSGRKKPYTEIGIRRLGCVRCGRPSTQQWRACADGLWRPICTECDIELNGKVLVWMRDPDAAEKIAEYRLTLGEK